MKSKRNSERGKEREREKKERRESFLSPDCVIRAGQVSRINRGIRVRTPAGYVTPLFHPFTSSSCHVRVFRQRLGRRARARASLMRVITATSDIRDGYRGYELYERGWISPGSLVVNCCPRRVFARLLASWPVCREMNFRRDFLLRQRVIAGVKDI